MLAWISFSSKLSTIKIRNIRKNAFIILKLLYYYFTKKKKKKLNFHSLWKCQRASCTVDVGSFFYFLFVCGGISREVVALGRDDQTAGRRVKEGQRSQRHRGFFLNTLTPSCMSLSCQN